MYNQSDCIYNLHIKPTYAVLVKDRGKKGNVFSAARVRNEANLKDNRTNGQISKKAAQRLGNAVNWLVASAKNKTVFDKSTGKNYQFKINFITLTLPNVEQECTDHFFKNVLLRNFLNSCRYSHGLVNYVWKVETQANGNIHCHLTCDTFIHYEHLRKIWNRILAKYNLLDTYKSKHSSMSESAYIATYVNAEKSNIDSLRQRYAYGVATAWASPNTTDVHAVHKVKDIAAYMAKYMKKNNDERRSVHGKLWACSYSLSAKNTCTLEMFGGVDSDILSELANPNIEYKKIESTDKLTGRTFLVGELFLFKMSYWGSRIKGRLLEHYNNHRFLIRNGLRDVYNRRDAIPKYVLS